MLSPAFVLLLQQLDPVPLPPEPPPLSQPPPAAGADALITAQQAVQRPGATLLNPALSIILDTTFGYYGKDRAAFQALGLPPAGDDPSAENEGFGLQEVEIAASAAIDAYLEGALFLAIPNLEGIEVEEGYLVTTSLPANLQLKAGTFRSQVSRNNTQHLHAQSFTRRPLLTPLLFGVDGFRGPGLQASVLLPLPWFATLYGEAFSLGAPEEQSAGAATFGGGERRSPGSLTYAATLEQYWDLTENASLLLGLAFATGKAFDCTAVPAGTPCDPAAAASPRSALYGGSLYFQWKPPTVARTYSSLRWTTELFARSLGDGGPTEAAGYTEAVLQVARRFYLGGRFDLTGIPSGPSVPRRYGGAAAVTFAASEFSRVRLYLQELTGAGVDAVTVAFLQAEFSIGAHGAHAF
jgi:hypothetical protein